MRPGLINLLASLATLLLLPFALGAGPSLDFSSFFMPAQPNFSTFGNPYYTPGFPPRQLTRGERLDQKFSQCVSSFRGTTAQSDFLQPVCQCLAPAQVDLSSDVERNEAGKRCRAQMLEKLSHRADLLDRFDQVFGQTCNGKFLNRDGRIDDQRAQPVCACMAKRIRSNPLRAAAFAYADGEVSKKGAWEDQLVADSDQCTPGTDVFKSYGWQEAIRDGQRIGVLKMPEHPDIEELQLSCGYGPMRLNLKYWPNSKYVDKLTYRDDYEDTRWEIKFNRNTADGDQVVKFYQYMLDSLEINALNNSDGKANDFILAVPDPNNNSTVSVRAGDFRKFLPSVLEKCIPKTSGKIYSTPSSSDVIPPSVLPDRWRYGGRSANYDFSQLDIKMQAKTKDGVPLLTFFVFSCQEKPTIALSGGFSDYEKNLPSQLRITAIPNGPAVSLPVKCAEGEGGVVCEAKPTQVQIESFIMTPAISIEAGNRKLADITFGASQKLREVLPHCAFPQGQISQQQQAPRPTPTGSSSQNVPMIAATPPASLGQPTTAPTPEVKTGTRYTLIGAMNLRAFPANDGRRLRELAVGTELTIRNKSQDRDGAWWSAVAIDGQDAGHVKDSALVRNTRPDSPGTRGSPQIAAVSRSDTNNARTSQQTCANELTRASVDHERASQEFYRAFRTSFAESEPMQVRCRIIQTYLKSSERLVYAAKRCPSADQSRSIIDKQNSETASIKRPAQSLGCNM